MSAMDLIRERRNAEIRGFAAPAGAVNEKTTKRGTISQDGIEQGGAWVDIRTEDGGGKVFVKLEVDKAYAEGQSITVNGDKGYF